MAPTSKLSSLHYLCKSVIVANLERYPPEAFGICDDEAWIALVAFRRKKTRPKEGTGGLDGTGRMVPAVSDKFLEAVEECNPHLAENPVTDEMLWKDCVEYRFKRGGLTRPPALYYPWTILIEMVQSATNIIITSQDTASGEATPVDNDTLKGTISTLAQIPMNVSLLRDSGVGKTLKKFLKSPPATLDVESINSLKTLLSSWMELAASSGVAMKGFGPEVKSEADEFSSSGKEDELEDMTLAESCSTWHQLFVALKQREEDRRNSQGRRMRERRQKLAATRPKLVKVRPSSNSAAGMAGRLGQASPFTSSASGNGAKLLNIRSEMAQVKKLQQVNTKSSFADAVAFASGSSKGAKHRARATGVTDVQISGNKRMKIPAHMVNGTGLRQFASKWKKY